MREKNFELDPFKGSFGNLENLVDKISEVLECPVTIEDTNHRLLAYSSHDDRTDPARIATIIGRRVPEKVLNLLWRHGIISTLNKSDAPVRFSEDNSAGLGDRVAIAIRTKNEVLGYIWVLEIDKKLSENGLTLLKRAAQTAKNHLLQLKIRKKKKEERQKEFFWQLLTGHLSSNEEINEQLEQLSVSPNYPITVVIFRFENEITEKLEQHISYLITTTMQLRVTFYAIERNDLILLCSPLPTKNDSLNIKQFIDEFIFQMNIRYHINNIKGGSGNFYESYEKVEYSYQQASKLLRLKQLYPEDLDHVFTYQELGIYRYLDLFLQKNEEEYYENTSLEKLNDYDALHKTELYKSLEVFLNKDSNVNDAAKQLHIHTNTLNYRLKRISEITEINLKNPNEKTALFIDIKLNKLKKRPCL